MTADAPAPPADADWSAPTSNFSLNLTQLSDSSSWLAVEVLGAPNETILLGSAGHWQFRPSEPVGSRAPSLACYSVSIAGTVVDAGVASSTDPAFGVVAGQARQDAAVSAGPVRASDSLVIAGSAMTKLMIGAHRLPPDGSATLLIGHTDPGAWLGTGGNLTVLVQSDEPLRWRIVDRGPMSCHSSWGDFDGGTWAHANPATIVRGAWRDLDLADGGRVWVGAGTDVAGSVVLKGPNGQQWSRAVGAIEMGNVTVGGQASFVACDPDPGPWRLEVPQYAGVQAQQTYVHAIIFDGAPVAPETDCTPPSGRP